MIIKTTVAVVLVLLLHVTNCDAQVELSGDLEDRIRDHINALPVEGGDDYHKPTDPEFNTWGETLDFLLSGEYANAATSAAELDYDLIAFTDDDTDRLYYILENQGANYWGTYVYYPDYVIPLVVQSPHPEKDFNTGKQGAYVFKNTDAMFFFLAGTDRCNSGATVNCTGETEVCGPKGPFKKSDLAHNDSTFFQSATDTLFRRFDDTYFLQLHGFAKKDTDPYVILSNGSKEPPENDFISILKDQLQLEDGGLTFEVAHENEDWNRLIGRTNTQGRLINGSDHVCSEHANINNGRFIHLEQEKTRLRSDESGWAKVANAVESSFNQLLPVELLYFRVNSVKKGEISLEWSTLSESDNDYFWLQRSQNGKLWRNILRIKGAGNSSSQLTYSAVDRSTFDGVRYYRLKQVDFDGSFTYSAIKMVNSISPRPLQVKIYPNPTESKVTIEADGGLITQVDFFDYMSRKVSDQVVFGDLGQGSIKVDLKNLQQGIYLVMINESVSLRLIRK
ncbi:MAG: T9SS type A sorting domain-containing protein [Bacteroidota bacterium]